MHLSTLPSLPCSNMPLKEDIFVFEGQQLEKLLDLEEHLLALPAKSSQKDSPLITQVCTQSLSLATFKLL